MLIEIEEILVVVAPQGAKPEPRDLQISEQDKLKREILDACFEQMEMRLRRDGRR